jgi:hypothetical protein
VSQQRVRGRRPRSRLTTNGRAEAQGPSDVPLPPGSGIS